jgi:hypothetical protein
MFLKASCNSGKSVISAQAGISLRNGVKVDLSFKMPVLKTGMFDESF